VKAKGKALSARMKKSVTELTRIAGTNPFLQMNLMTASEYMKYFVKVKKKVDNKLFLSISSFGNKQSALCHLFRVHNQTGYSEIFRRELSNLCRGFYRQIVKQKPENKIGIQEGKEPMSVELYKC
jgi:hypothetical protein